MGNTLIFAQNCNNAGSNLNEENIKNQKMGPDSNRFQQPLSPQPPGYAVVYPKGHHKRPANTESDNAYIQQIINNNSLLFFMKGEYYVSDIVLKDNMALVGQAGASLKGSVAISGYWNEVNPNKWEIKYTEPLKVFGSTVVFRCADPSSDICRYSQDIFINGMWGNQVDNLNSLQQDGDWYFDDDGDKIILYSASFDPNDEVIEISQGFRAFYDGGNNDLTSTRHLSNIQVKNLTFDGYTHSGFITGNNWRVAFCEFKNNHVTGLRVLGDDVIVKNSLFHANGGTGINGSAINSLITANEMTNNNKANYSPGWNAAGMKVNGVINLEVSYNYVHDNEGIAGLWNDSFSLTVDYHHNLIENNLKGIHFEISSDASIHHNTLRNNSAYAIHVVSSPEGEIFNNTIQYSQNGIVIFQDHRGYAGNCVTDPLSNANCHLQVRNINVAYNDILLASPVNVPAGLAVKNVSCNDCVPERFYNNEYQINFEHNNYVYPLGTNFNTIEEDKAFYWGWNSSSASTSVIPWNKWTLTHDANACLTEYSNLNARVSTKKESHTKKLTDKSSRLNAFPTPFNNTLNLNIGNTKKSVNKVLFTNLSGKTFKHKTFKIDYNLNVLSVDTSQLPDDLYIVTVKSGSEFYQLKVVKISE